MQQPQWADPSISSMPGGMMSGTMGSTDPSMGMGAGGHQEALFQPYSTLDEPVMETIMRDVQSVVSKLKVVMLPLDRAPDFVAGYSGISQSEDGGMENGQGEDMSENDRKVIQSLKDWDLWGPLIVCLILAVLLSFKAPTNQASLVFASVFITVWCGSAVVTVNAQLLGGNISFFQSVCVLGYCIFPLTLAAFVIDILKLTWFSWEWLDMVFLAAAFLWATRASSVFIGLYVKRERRFLAVFPVLFFYTFVAWIILLF
ncbi:Protein YIPF6 [Seminavis robusta]|uniref:Protein YIPF n=1 Tax=Seminavis robusta TaxID=568900 RepID=A0A9N8H783_9STRA|nr:Protein YIPF6 [Seminavis robusta]|eukprot:Sro170_g075350.1 Protein YIPF6 (258) ;mRNA; r:26200-27330